MGEGGKEGKWVGGGRKGVEEGWWGKGDEGRGKGEGGWVSRLMNIYVGR